MTIDELWRKDIVKENVLLEKALAFGIRIMKLSEYLEEKKKFSMANQVLRSGTSISANISESVYAASKPDFINKLQIARKEANETKNWLNLLIGGNWIEKKIYDSLLADVEELLRILGASVKTARQ